MSPVGDYMKYYFILNLLQGFNRKSDINRNGCNDAK
jgi:hypothetical protein